MTPTVAVGTPHTGTVPVPTADDSLKTSINDFEKCYVGGGTCATTGSFLANTGIKYDDGTASGTTLPSWITYTSTGTSTQTVVIDPPDGTVIGSHTLFATFTSTHGADPFYTAFTFTVTCQVTSFALPSNPSDVTYTLFTSSLEVDLTGLVYVQSPACGYAYTSSLTWTGLETFITSTTDFIVDVYSQAISTAGTSAGSPSQTYALTLENDLTIASNGPGGTENFASGGNTIGFSVTITNPCYTATIPTLVFNPSS